MGEVGGVKGLLEFEYFTGDGKVFDELRDGDTGVIGGVLGETKCKLAPTVFLALVSFSCDGGRAT